MYSTKYNIDNLPSGLIIHLEALEDLNNQVLVAPYPDIIKVYLDLILDNLTTASFPAVKVIIQELTIYLTVEARDCNNSTYLKTCFINMLIVVGKLIPSLKGGD